ncbi:hypothetical protein [Streptomyces niveus]|uniref:hypothetical protein n=1 Tax=Streptomyces niveus TaxID=193462 RepID=UPI00386BC203|nr:hypothetical protein OG211_12295 [Streptomyces niveus]
MNIGLLIGLTRARVALLVAGLAWFFGLAPDFPARLAIAGLVLAALAFDGLLDEQRIGQTKTTADRQHQTTN